MTLHFTDVSHTGYVVADLDAAMAELGDALSLRWARPQQRRLRLRTPDGPLQVELRYTYSADEAPLRLELFEHVDGTPWEVSQGPGRLHHLGFWVDDLAGESARLTGLGAPLQVTYDSPAGGVSGFVYHRLPSGLLVELVDAARRPDFERWWAGGDLVAHEPTR
ncbi:MAG TPA: VOC family protein [Egibacteraceae bacterium]